MASEHSRVNNISYSIESLFNSSRLGEHCSGFVSNVSHPGRPKKVKALIISFQAETRSTRAQGGNPYYIPEGITLDEHNDLATEAGTDPQEYVRRNYHGTSSSQPYSHQAHILPPRWLVNRHPTNLS